MSQTIPASDLSPGDYLKTPQGVACLTRVPFDKSGPFTVHYSSPAERREEPITFEPDEIVEVLSRWPVTPWH